MIGAICFITFMYAVIGTLPAILLGDSDFANDLEREGLGEASTVYSIVVGVTWGVWVPLYVLYKLGWLLLHLRVCARPFNYIGRGFRDLYRHFFPKKVKLPKARVC